MAAHEKPGALTREGNTITRTFIVYDVLDYAQAEAQAYAAADLTYGGFVRQPGPRVRETHRGIFEAEFEYKPPGGDDDDPQNENPTLGTLEMDASGGTRHVTQCISQVGGPPGKGQGIVDAKVVGWHKDGVNGVDIDIPGSVFRLTKKWLPQAIGGNYLLGLAGLRGKTNQSPYTLAWGYRNVAYSITFDARELRFLNSQAKTSFNAKTGVGAWDITYEFLYSKNREDLNIGENITLDFLAGHDYLWVVYKKKTIQNPATTIEVPEMAFVAQMYEEENYQAVLGF
jgi:hypothetical protein